MAVGRQSSVGSQKKATTMARIAPNTAPLTDHDIDTTA